MVRSLQRPDRWLWVACAEGEVVGFARLARLAAADPSTSPPEGMYLGGVSVSPERRRQGIGRALTLTRVHHAFTEQGADRLWYFANVRNEASIALHAEFGFVEVQRPMRFAPIGFVGGAGALFMLSREVFATLSETA